MGNHTTPFKARPTVYKGIEMRSRLEAQWAAEFDLWKREEEMEWEYEPFCFANETFQYLPDFKLTWPSLEPTPIYVEIKSYLPNPVSLMKKMEIIFDSDADANLWIYVGQPNKNPSHYICQQFGMGTWFEWIGDSEDNHTFSRQVPPPQWFVNQSSQMEK